MKLLCASLVLLTVASCRSASDATPREVSFTTADGIKVYADVHRTKRGAPVVLLFHQGGGDARGEYGPLVPWLQELGLNVITVDQRLGGNRFGGTNRTAAVLDEDRYTFCEAYPDLEAALQFSRREFNAKPIVWGSSYSATLAIKLAAEHPREVAGVLAFSPAGGEPMAGCEVNRYLEKLTVPILVFRPPQEMELPHVREQAKVFEAHGIKVNVPTAGTHGSSMLVAERVKAPVDETRRTVAEFLASVTRAQ